MDEDLNLVLTQEVAIPKRTTPTGRTLGVMLTDQYFLWSVRYVDGKAGDLPTELAGRWTKAETALEAVDAYNKKLWDMSEAQRITNARKTYRQKTEGTVNHAIEGESPNTGT